MVEPVETDETGSSAEQRSDTLPVTLAIGVFVLGLVCGIPATIFGLDFFIDNAVTLFAVLFGLLLIASILTGIIVAFRRPILRTVVKRSEVEMERLAGPLADVAKFAAQQNVEKATNAAKEVGELMLARYAWMATRRWLIATITAFVAAIAALAGSALLFQQNQLLREQGKLLAGQSERLVEQNSLLGQQIELGEAQRSTSIVPEILALGAQIGEETNALLQDGRPAPIYFDQELSHALRGRIIAATAAARPYRYLALNLPRASNEMLTAMSLARRDDVPSAQIAVQKVLDAERQLGAETAQGELIQHPVSPERGQILSLLYNARVMSTEWLTLNGADFSFSEIRNHTFGVISLRHALLRFADFSGVQIHQGDFRAAFLDNARFNRAFIQKTQFSGIPNDQIQLPQTPDPSVEIWHTQMAGTDFRGAVINSSGFMDVNALAANFDFTIIENTDFSNASIVGATFKNAVLGELNFTGTNLASVDFDGAYVLRPDFLRTIQNQAMADTFVEDRFAIELADISDLETHPNAIQITEVFTDITPEAPIWRIKRVGEFR